MTSEQWQIIIYRCSAARLIKHLYKKDQVCMGKEQKPVNSKETNYTRILHDFNGVLISLIMWDLYSLLHDFTGSGKQSVMSSLIRRFMIGSESKSSSLISSETDDESCAQWLKMTWKTFWQICSFHFLTLHFLFTASLTYASRHTKL